MKFPLPKALDTTREAELLDRAAASGRRMEELARELAEEWDRYEAVHLEARQYRAQGRVAAAVGLPAGLLHPIGQLKAGLRALTSERHAAANPKPAPAQLEPPMTMERYLREKARNPSWLWGVRSSARR